MRYAKCRKPKWYWAFSARIAGEPGALKGARRVRREAARKRPGFTQHEHGTSLGGPPYSSCGMRPVPRMGNRGAKRLRPDLGDLTDIRGTQGDHAQAGSSGYLPQAPDEHQS